MKKFSIVIPNLHSPILDKVVDAIRQQTYPLDNVEIIIVGLDKYNLVQNDELVTFISTQKPVPPAPATNIGLKKAQGEIICLLDADCIANPDWLSTLDRYFSDPNTHVISGTFQFPTDHYWTIADSLAHYSEVLGQEKTTLQEAPSQNMAFRRQVIEDVGLLDERFPRPGGEDTEFTRRIHYAGYPILFAPDVTVYHQITRQSLPIICERAFRFGRYSVWALPDKIWQQRRPRFLSHWFLALISSPASAVYFTLLTFKQHPHLRRFWTTFPAIVMARFLWRIGVARALWKPEIEKTLSK